jgi:SAM-dependent methyltransferase
MTREHLIRRHFTRDMQLLEIGPSYNPILPKADGWKTRVLDHATQADLVEKYRGLGAELVDRIEPVDFLWTEGSLAEAIPSELHGSFDGVVASHVLEHLPDLIGFFQSASALLKPDGLIALALPDKRVCFDFFQPLSMTGDVLAARVERRTRHQPRTLFNQAAYQVTRRGRLGWEHDDNASPYELLTPFAVVRAWHPTAQATEGTGYRDSHAWVFTPKSFELLMLELNLLGEVEWAIRDIEPTPAVEFLVWLERRHLEIPEEHIDQHRLPLLLGMVREAGATASQLGALATAPPESQKRQSLAVGEVGTVVRRAARHIPRLWRALNRAARG